MHRQKGNILLTGGNATSLAALREELLPYFNVFTAQDARAAYKLLSEYTIHAAMSAERLPDMTGIQFFESIKTDFPNVVSIVQSSTQNFEPLKAAARADKIHMFLRNDADLDEILQTLATSVSHQMLKSENSELVSRLSKKEKEQERILKIFNRYVPEQVVSQTLSYNDNNLLQGETRVVSVLFADIRGFSKIASRISPSDVVKFLNDFWSTVSKPVTLHHGSINKFIGDGILALFGAPVSHIGNQENAVLSALDMMEALARFNEEYEEVLGQKIQIGIGINTGEVVVGNVGTDDHMEYTVIGDAVNIASKIESRTKENPNSILISDATYLHVKDLIDVEEVDPLKMDGKEKPVKLYEVKARKSESNIKPIRKNLGL